MSKSQFKVPFISREVMLKCFHFNKKKQGKKNIKKIYFFSRNSLLPFLFIYSELYIYQGIYFKKYITDKRQRGFKMGEFARTRKKSKNKDIRLKIGKKQQKKIKSAIFTYDLKSKFFT